MAPQDPQAAALLAHLVSQIEQNVNFLASQNYMSQNDASVILTRLPKVASDSDAVNNLTNSISHMRMPTPRAVPPPPPPPPVASEPASLPQARAIWAYNEHGQDPDDLQFSAGDAIEVIEEINPDWWRGRLNGKQGLFPSSYVEKIVPAVKSTKPYKPFGAAYHGMAVPPPPGEGTNNIGLQEKPGTEEKKSKMAGYKNTVAHSAVAGVGFGAGSAIGGGLVRAIF